MRAELGFLTTQSTTLLQHLTLPICEMGRPADSTHSGAGGIPSVRIQKARHQVPGPQLRADQICAFCHQYVPISEVRSLEVLKVCQSPLGSHQRWTSDWAGKGIREITKSHEIKSKTESFAHSRMLILSEKLSRRHVSTGTYPGGKMGQKPGKAQTWDSGGPKSQAQSCSTTSLCDAGKPT